MRLVDNNEVKTSRRELLRLGIDVPDHRLMRREHDAGVLAALKLLVRKDRIRHVRQLLDELLERLSNKLPPISEEQDILNPPVARQDIDQRDRHTRLARSRSENEKSLAMLAVKMFADALNRRALVRPPRNLGIGIHVPDPPARTQRMHSLEFLAPLCSQSRFAADMTASRATFARTTASLPDKAAAIASEIFL